MKSQDRTANKKSLSGGQVILLELLAALVLIACLALFYSGFLFSRVQGRSMEPTYNNSDFLLCNRKAALHRQDIVCFQAQGRMLGDRETRISLRRIIGIPGDTVAIAPDGTVTVNGQALEEPYLADGMQAATCRDGYETTLTLGNNEYFVLGDCREISVDSRDYGALSGDVILGRVPEDASILVYTLTIAAPLCVALALFCLLDLALRRRCGK